MPFLQAVAVLAVGLVVFEICRSNYNDKTDENDTDRGINLIYGMGAGGMIAIYGINRLIALIFPGL